MDNKPIILSDNDISALKGKHGVVLFYLDGCNPCNMIKPTWNKVIDELKEKHKDEIILGAIESRDIDMFKKNGISPSVSSFPTILYFHPNNISRNDMYNGDRSYEDIKEWIIEKKNRNSGVKKHNTHTKKISNTKGYQGGGASSRYIRRKRSIQRGTKRRYGSRMRINKRRKSIRRTRKTNRKQSGGGCGCGVDFFGTLSKKTKQQQ